MLLVTLMVLITLGIGQRIRENHELNNLADAAAYSSAVVNARAFNDIAMLNRLQVSYWVSMAANESLISWTSYSRALWNASYANLKAIAEDLNNSAPGRVAFPALVRPPAVLGNFPLPGGISNDCRRVYEDSTRAYQKVANDFTAAMAGWDASDNLAGDETFQIQMVIATLRSESRGMPTDNVRPPSGMRDRLFRERLAQNVARRIVLESKVSGVSVVPLTGSPWPSNSAAAVSAREVGDYGLGLYDDCTDVMPGLCMGSTQGSWSDAVLHAAMGTRGNPFTTSRGVLSPKVQAEWAAVDGAFPSSIRFTGGTPVGSAYWNVSMTHGTAAENTFAWADDHGQLGTTVTFNRCSRSRSVPVTSYVKTTDLLNTAGGDQHQWDPDDIGSGGDPAADAEQHHTVGDCTPLCPSVWVRQVNFNPYRNRPEDAYGQPKSVVMLVRDTSASTVQSQPWKLNFRFGFSAGGSIFDNRGERLHGSSAGAGLAINSQTAVATGMTYYHRKGAWLEHPNLLNPFWRATLVPATVDDGDDMGLILSRPSETWQADAYEKLVLNGFKGVH